MTIYAFWNNKGGTGKTSLAFQTICSYAKKHEDKKILVVDVCPQANLSELLLGGLNNGSANLLKLQEGVTRQTIGGYFQLRFPTPYKAPDFAPENYLVTANEFNKHIPRNIKLLCGDPLLELQANAISTLANTQIPTTDAWVSIIDWLSDFLRLNSEQYTTVFIDLNPSFSIYTQIALSAADRLLMPVMADDSSRRAISNAFSLIYGLKLPSEIYSQYAFATKLQKAERRLPKIALILKNRITQYMGPASAYATVLKAIEDDIRRLLYLDKNNALSETNKGIGIESLKQRMFAFDDINEGVIDIRDFQTTGVVSYARGCPFYDLTPGKLEVNGKRIQVQESYRQNCIAAVDSIVSRLS